MPYGNLDWVALSQPYGTPTATPTATVTLTPTFTSTATMTPTAIVTPTATVTPTSQPIPAGRDTLTARVFIDYRCNRFFQTGLDVPLGDVSVTLSFPNGTRRTLKTRPFGLVYFAGFSASNGVTVSVSLPADHKGLKLASCFNSPTSVQLEPTDFQFGFKFVQFGADVVGEVAGP